MKIIGHRGARGLAPENTIASLQKAIAHNVDEIEFDLRVTKDNAVILHHDPYLTDPDGSKVDIATNTYSELKKHKGDIALFQEALESIGKNFPLYVEVKPDVDTKPIIKILNEYLSKGWRMENLKLASFSYKVLSELDAEFPEIDKVVLEKWSGVRAARKAKKLNTRYISMNQKWLWWGFIRQVSRAGWKLYTYTLNDPVKAKKWEKHGLYAVVTDRPDLFEK